jgi:hypothetical protein
LLSVTATTATFHCGGPDSELMSFNWQAIYKIII